MRDLGKRIPLSGDLPKRFSGEVVSDLKPRQEGVRIQHRVNGNSLKLYAKAFTLVGSVLQAERPSTTAMTSACTGPRRAIRTGSWLGA